MAQTTNFQLTSATTVGVSEIDQSVFGSGTLAVRYVEGAEWDDFAAGYADVVSEQTSCFMESRWGRRRTERIIIEQDGTPIGGAVIAVFRAPGTSKGLAIVKWGPIWRVKDAGVDATRLSQTLHALTREYVDRRGYFLSIMPHADPEFGDAMVSGLQGLGYIEGTSLPFPDRYLVNVAQSADELRASFDQKWRYNLKKSLKNGLETEFIPAPEGFPMFMKLYEQMMGRKKFQDTSAINTLPDLVHSNEKSNVPQFVFAYHDGTPTAGAVVSAAGERAVYLYGATDDRALRLKAGYALHWRISEWLCDLQSVRWYDLGGSDGDQGLHQFKKGFCGKTGQIIETPPTFHLYQSGIDSIIGKSIYLARDAKALISQTLYKAKQLRAS